MSKYLSVVLLSFLVSTAYGMDLRLENETKDGEENNGTLVPVAQSSAQREINDLFLRMPIERFGQGLLSSLGLGSPGELFIKRAVVASFLQEQMLPRLEGVTIQLTDTQRKLNTTSNALRQTTSRLEGSAASLENTAAAHRALEEAQQEVDTLRRELRESQFQREAAELVITTERKARAELLTAKTGAEADRVAQGMRVRDLEEHIREKDKIIADLRLAVSEKTSLTEERQRLQALLASKRTVDTPRGEGLVDDLEALISQKEDRGLFLEREIVRLEKEKLEKETLIEQYKVSVHMGDPYNYIVGLIEQPISEISDKRLRTEILCVMTRTGQNLDQLSVGKPKTIVSKLIRASRPTKAAYQSRGINRDTDPTYRSYGYREIGNDFENLGWGGTTLDPDSYSYVGSGLERKNDSAASILG